MQRLRAAAPDRVPHDFKSKQRVWPVVRRYYLFAICRFRVFGAMAILFRHFRLFRFSRVPAATLMADRLRPAANHAKAEEKALFYVAAGFAIMRAEGI
jgi:hypothetical protein